MPAFDLDAFLPYQLAVLASRVSRGLAEHYRSRYGIGIPEWRVLAHLHQSGAVSVREIHARADMDKSKVSRAAARLETAGLVRKQPNGADRRLVEMTLTPRGREMMEDLIPIARAYEAETLAVLGPREEAFRAAIGTLLETTK